MIESKEKKKGAEVEENRSMDLSRISLRRLESSFQLLFSNSVRVGEKKSLNSVEGKKEMVNFLRRG